VSGQRSGAPVAAATRPAKRRTRRGGNFAGQADERQGVAAVRLDVDVEDDVAVQVDEGHADRRVGRQDQDPVGVAGQIQLVPGAEHPVADDAHLLGPLDPAVPRQDGAGQGHWHPLASRDVRCPADDRERLSCPVGPHPNGGQRQTIGVRMLLDAQQLADDDVLPVAAPPLDALDLHPEQRQPLGERLRREVELDVVAQP
jgi:hypothetical protein